MSPNEEVVVDKGWLCSGYSIKCQEWCVKDLMNRAQACHETINAILKKWWVLKQEFCHHCSKYCQGIEAVIAVTQLEI